MADFQEVMRQWKRMCDTYTTDDAVSCCKGCPMSGRGCGSIYESDNAEPDIIEREVMSWAKDNPEPVYPTWIDVMKMYGVTDETGYCYLDSAYKPIPADIAQKLGIEPKEEPCSE